MTLAILPNIDDKNDVIIGLLVKLYYLCNFYDILRDEKNTDEPNAVFMTLGVMPL